MTRILVLPLLLMLLALAGCNQSSESTAPAPAPEIAQEGVEQMGDEHASLDLCADPRPDICTQNYAPVCGVQADGSRRTYSNGCMACSNPEVVGHLPEACPE